MSHVEQVSSGEDETATAPMYKYIHIISYNFPKNVVDIVDKLNCAAIPSHLVRKLDKIQRQAS